MVSYKYIKDKDTNQDRTDVIEGTDSNGVKYFIPNDPRNRDWIKYQEWLSVPNTPQASD